MIARWSQDLYTQTFKFAAQAHLGQKIPGSDIPYLMHLSLVSMEIMAALHFEAWIDADLALQCALLHDVIEDTDVSYEDIKKKFGKKIADGVLAMTKDSSLEKRDQMADSLKRIKEQPKEIWMVKLADRIVNLQPPPSGWTYIKAKKYRLQAIEIHDALKDASVFLASRLKRKIEREYLKNIAYY